MLRGARVLAALLGGSLIVAAIWMLLTPSHWFQTFPGVFESGAFNVHLVRDLGVAFCLVGIGFSWSAWQPDQTRWMILAGTAFLVGHAVIHVAEALSLRGGHGFRLADVLTVYTPAALSAACSAVWLRGTNDRGVVA